MGTLNDKFQYVWYGTCEETSCTELMFTDLPSDTLSGIDSISTLSGATGFMQYNPSSSDTSSLDRFTCGKMYLVTLSPAAVNSGGIELHNSLASSSMSKLQRYGISTTCSEVSLQTPNPVATPSPAPVVTPTPSPAPVATPSPTPVNTQECIPVDFTKVTATNVGPASLGELGTGTFAKAGSFGYNTTDIQESGTAAQFFINIPGDLPLALFVSTSTFPTAGSEPNVYFEVADGDCYSGKLIKNPEDDNWTANLS